MSASADQPGQLDEIAEVLRASADELAWRQITVCRTFPAYDNVPDEDLYRSCRRNVFRVVETLRGRNILPVDISEDEGRPGGSRRGRGRVLLGGARGAAG
jgi:hypothetical protein